MVTGGISLFKRSFSQDRGLPPPAVLRATRVVDGLFALKGKRFKTASLKPSTADVGSFLGNMIFTGRTFMDQGPLNTIMGLFSSLSFLSGFWAYKSGDIELKEASDCQDKVGVVTAGLKKLEGITRTLFGAAFVSSFLSGLYLNIKSLSPEGKIPSLPSLVNRMVTYAGVAGEGIEMISLGAIGISSLVRLSEAAHVGMKLNREESSLEEKAEFLQKTFTFDVRKWLSQKKQLLNFQKQLEHTALKTLAKALKKESKKEERVGTQEAYDLYTKLFKDPVFAEEYRGRLLKVLKLSEKEMKEFSLLALFGLFEEVNKREMKKGKKRLRLLNDSTMRSIQKIKSMGMIERLGVKAPESVQRMAQAELLCVSRQVNRDLLVTMGSLLATFSMAGLGIAICSLSMLSLMGLSMAPPLWLVLLFIGMTVLLDITPLKNALYSGLPVRNDYLLLAIQALVVVTSFSMGIGIAVALHQAASALIKPALIAGSTLALSSFSLYRLRKREGEWRKENPTIEEVNELMQFIDEGEVPKELSSLFKKLPKEDRTAVGVELEKSSFVIDAYRKGLGSVFLQTLQEGEDLARYERGIKKAVKTFWREYQERQTENNYRNAIDAQRVFDLVRERRVQEAAKLLQSISSQARDRIVSCVQKVFKREESVKNLRRAIQRVLEERKKYKI